MLRCFRGLVLLAVVVPALAIAQGTPRDSLLVSRQWLSDHLKDPNLVLLHVGPPEGYDTAHIAGSQLVDLRALEKGNAPLGLELPSADTLKAFLERHGISNNSRIVVIPGNGWFSPATRVILTLDHAGFGGRTSMLDGGLTNWIKAGLPITKDVPTVPRGTVGTVQLRINTVTGEEVRDRTGKPGTALIDARAATYYDGVSEGGTATVRKKGHIPGAKSLPYLSVLDDGNLLQPAALLEKFRAAGVKPGDSIITYCHVGQQATLIVFAARTLGIDVKLYDGSFEDWVTRGWPVEVPPAK
jgi:thiosulfate/3-mercaptopyruvate sulfurtransferase